MEQLEAWLKWHVVTYIVARTAANYFIGTSCGRVCLQAHANHLLVERSVEYSCHVKNNHASTPEHTRKTEKK